ncbi:GspH/FimT family pseudopilin [Lysobacter sp. HA18]
MQSQNGFTLVEFLAGTAIAAILFSVGGPAFGRVIDSARCANALSQLTTSLATARIEAIRRNRPVSVCPSADGRNCRTDRRWEDGWIVFVDNGSGQPTSPVLERVDGLGTALAVSATDGRRLVRYLPDGWAAGTNSTLRVCTSRNHQLLASVVVNNSGRTRTERFGETPCPFD